MSSVSSASVFSPEVGEAIHTIFTKYNACPDYAAAHAFITKYGCMPSNRSDKSYNEFSAATTYDSIRALSGRDTAYAILWNSLVELCEKPQTEDQRKAHTSMVNLEIAGSQASDLASNVYLFILTGRFTVGDRTETPTNTLVDSVDDMDDLIEETAVLLLRDFRSYSLTSLRSAFTILETHADDYDACEDAKTSIRHRIQQIWPITQVFDGDSVNKIVDKFLPSFTKIFNLLKEVTDEDLEFH